MNDKRRLEHDELDAIEPNLQDLFDSTSSQPSGETLARLDRFAASIGAGEQDATVNPGAAVASVRSVGKRQIPYPARRWPLWLAIAAALAAVVGLSTLPSEDGGDTAPRQVASIETPALPAPAADAVGRPAAVEMADSDDDTPMFLAMLDDPLAGLGIDDDEWLDAAFDDGSASQEEGSAGDGDVTNTAMASADESWLGVDADDMADSDNLEEAGGER